MSAQPGTTAEALLWITALAVVLTLPGAGLRLTLQWLSHGRGSGSDGAPEALAESVALSMALWPLALLWFGGSNSLRVTAVALIGLTGVLLGISRRRHGLRLTPDRSGVTLAVLTVTVVALALRAYHARELLVPAWVDGLHHTEITALILGSDGLPSALAPYMPVQSFFYHFGFHATAAAAAALGDLFGSFPATAAVLWTGQAQSGLVALTLFPLVARLTGSRRAASVAVAVPATIYWFPSYFVTWTRFTQLAGLVILPLAWLHLHDAAWGAGRRSHAPGAIEDAIASSDAPRRGAFLRLPPGAGAVAVAAVTAAGTVLTHYRVAVLYGAGAAVITAGCIVFAGRRRSLEGRAPDVDSGSAALHLMLGRIAAVALLAALLAGPWLTGPFREGVSDLRTAHTHLAEAETAGRAWFEAGEGANTAAGWLFSTRFNAPVLALAGFGIALGLAAGRRGAWAAAATAAVAALAANPSLVGLPDTWMLPNFALAISAFMPATIGIGFLVALLIDAFGGAGSAAGVATPDADADHGQRRRFPGRALPVLALLLAVAGAIDWDQDPATWRLRPYSVVNPTTVLVESADIAAGDWIADNVDPGTGFLVTAAGWHLGTYRGLDGGYWLPVLTGNPVSMPGALYPYGAVDVVRRITRLGELSARGDKLSNSEIDALLAEADADYLYLGPASAEDDAAFHADRLRQHPGLTEVYSRDGAHVFKVK